MDTSLLRILEISAQLFCMKATTVKHQIKKLRLELLTKRLGRVQREHIMRVNFRKF